VAQAHKGTIARPRANTRPQFIQATNAILAVVAAGASLALVLPSLAPQAAAPTRPTLTHEAITDGWMPAAAAAQAARLDRIQDGYLSGLVPAQPVEDAVDGWLPSALAGQSAAWAGYASDPRDGWER
jgi:hypothetical protein